jgi:hypothetical protein
MLKNIRLHIEKDEEKQQVLEAQLAQHILTCQKDNINSFSRNIPSLLPLIQKPNLQNYSLFCNKFGEINVVDYGVGRTLYGFHPREEILKQVDNFNAHAPLVKLDGKPTSAPEDSAANANLPDNFKNSRAYQQYAAYAPAPSHIDCLVVLGCGLATHILALMEQKTINCMIIYEPEIQYFHCSVLVAKWHDIFHLAKQKGTKLFLQIEKDGRNLVDDIDELVEFEHINHFHVYKHYNHPVFNSVVKELAGKSWSELRENGISFSFNEHYHHYLPTWTPSIDIATYSSCSQESSLFQRNLAALAKYFPNIYEEFKDYQAQIWLPVENSQQHINLIKADSLTPWYSDNSKHDCLLNYENYNEQPHKDGLILGYRGTKLAHYLHYQFVKETEKLLQEAEDEVGALPEKIESIILFGLGVGYQLESLLAHHSVDKLFICEPNSDFFYASLFAIDWDHIFTTINDNQGRIYLNIGDDGTHLFRDLLSQFHSIGPYILNNTYFYQSYYNASLNIAIAQLREQLQIVISMGEYFDHAYYGIAHTKEGFRRNIPILTKDPAKQLSYDDKEVPVFIVGNGPSLDLSIEAIKEWQSQAIIISCGTALQALHRHGITPDFHAEIEQNRSTYDWAVLIDDLAYLKNITLLSCNGIHPDTCDLYKDVLIAFKEGESSTVSATSVLGQNPFEVLQHAFPTVSNFATNLVSVVGFNHIYFMGVDLGFVDVKHHHSRSSGYYQENGQETFDYAENNNTSLIVPGNFRPKVNTKHEFKISRQIIEQVTLKKFKLQTFYNCSDGAKISGTHPLQVDNLLIMSTSTQKAAAINTFKTAVFSTAHNAKFIDKFDGKFSKPLLMEELASLQALVENSLDNSDEDVLLVNKQKELLFISYQNSRSLLFYYLYGTLNYANAVLSKLQSAKTSSGQVSTAYQQAKTLWLATLQKITKQLSLEGVESFDTSSFNILKRETQSLQRNYASASLLIVSNSPTFVASTKFVIQDQFPWLKNVNFVSSEAAEHIQLQSDFVYYHHPDCSVASVKKGKINTLITLSTEADTPFNYEGVTYIKNPVVTDVSVFDNPIFLARLVITALFSNHHCDLILPKYRACDKAVFGEQVLALPTDDYIAYNHLFYVSVFSANNRHRYAFKNNSGSRAMALFESIKMKHLLYKLMSEEELEQFKDKIDAVLSENLKK